MRSHGAKEPMKHACCMAAWASSCPERRMRAKPTFRWIKGWFLGRMYAHMRAQWVFTHEPVRSVKLWSLFPFSKYCCCPIFNPIVPFPGCAILRPCPRWEPCKFAVAAQTLSKSRHDGFTFHGELVCLR